MQPIIRRTITITITETWTITWPDGHETKWETTREVIRPTDSDQEATLPPTKADENARHMPNPDLDDQSEHDT